MTKRQRSIFAGMTDYTSVPMDVILSDLRDWRDNTARTIEELRRMKGQVEAHQNGFYCPNEILAYINFFIDLFGRYVGDLERLLADLPRRVRRAHVQIIRQIFDSASREEKRCVRFKHEHIESSRDDPDLLWLVDNIYCESREMLIDYMDLSNLVPRLRTFIGATIEAPSNSDSDRSFPGDAGESRVSDDHAGEDLRRAREGERRASRSSDQKPAHQKTGLGHKQQDLSRYLDSAKLTARQRECLSLRLEYGLSKTVVAQRLGIDRKTLDEHISAAERKFELLRAKECADKNLGKVKPGSFRGR